MKVVARGVESTDMLAAGESDIALGPVSELVNRPGVEFVGPLPADVQLVQVFTAAIAKGSTDVEGAKRLIAFLSSAQAAAAIKRSGMTRWEITRRVNFARATGRPAPRRAGPSHRRRASDLCFQQTFAVSVSSAHGSALETQSGPAG